ncbi:hypothetical protein [Halobacteriovorax sp. DPLXC-1]|uniref:hypothetical protein n=1 Tax=Halobacteriovorax sp. DPLXC-1 TaxID=3110771 RepID=UPI002FF3E170
MKKLLFVFIAISSLSLSASARDAQEGYYYEYQKNKPVENSIVFYERNEGLMKFSGNSLEGFENYTFYVNSANQVVSVNEESGVDALIGEVDLETCVDTENYQGREVFLCLISFYEDNGFEMEKDKKLVIRRTANGFPRGFGFDVERIFSLIIDGREVGNTSCIDNFLSCRF